jgi:hypothetical protein
MVKKHRLSFPSAPSEPSIRRLGVRSSGQIERPIRPQVILLVLAALVLLAVPLYLLRSPAVEPSQEPKKGPVGFAPSVPAGLEQEKEDERLSLGEVQRVSCSSAQGVTGKSGRLCDEVPFFEKAFERAIKEAIDCAPRTGDGGTLNYVLSVDFNNNRLHVFPGASGMWKGPQARRATECVKQALPAPDWEKLPHNFRYYELAILATYKSPPPSSVPLFE